MGLIFLLDRGFRTGEKLNIGINLLALLPGVSGGIEFYVRNLLSALAEIDADNDYYLFTNQDNHATFYFDNPHFNLIRMKVGARPQIGRITWEQFVLPIMAIRHRLDVLHSPSYTFPVLAPVPGVLTICDMLYKVYPQTIDQPKLAFWRIFIPLSARKCRKILTISDNSKRDVMKYLRTMPEKVVATPLALDSNWINRPQPSASDSDRVRVRYGIPNPYFLSVGGVGPHKNPLALVRALAATHQLAGATSVDVVITGHDYGSMDAIVAEAGRLNIGEHVRLPGYVAREDLPALYGGALAYVSPSHFEGFGLTLLEAMSAGTPVVASDRGSLPEVAGDAAILVDPDNAEQLARALHRLVVDSDFRAELIERGKRRLQAFSWQRTAELTLAAYYAAAGPN